MGESQKAMSSGFDQPSIDSFVAGSTLTVAGVNWMTRIHAIALSQQQSGPTGDRPVTGLWIGRQFYDTTLNKPVYVRTVKPVQWRDAAGVVV